MSLDEGLAAEEITSVSLRTRELSGFNLRWACDIEAPPSVVEKCARTLLTLVTEDVGGRHWGAFQSGDSNLRNGPHHGGRPTIPSQQSRSA